MTMDPMTRLEAAAALLEGADGGRSDAPTLRSAATAHALVAIGQILAAGAVPADTTKITRGPVPEVNAVRRGPGRPRRDPAES